MSQDLAIARAVLTSALLRSEPGVADIARDDAALFARSLLRACNICTSANVKLCRSFIVKYVLPSDLRTSALVKYLVTLSKASVPRDPDIRVDTTKTGDEHEGLGRIVNGKVQQPPEPAFRRLHVLYIVHDVLCYAHLHSPRKGVSEQFKAHVTVLLELAACGCSGKAIKTRPYILDLISNWETARIFDQEASTRLRETVQLADRSDWDTVLARLTAAEEQRAQEEKRRRDDATKWVVPARHGLPHDPAAPWHELPAANGLYLRRSFGSPLRAAALPPGGFELRRGGAEAPPELKAAVAALHAEALRCFDRFPPADEVLDVDALGNVIWKSAERPTRNFWGFALDGIEQRRRLAKRFAETASGYGGVIDGAEGRYGGAVERARTLAAERNGRAAGRGRGYMPGQTSWTSRGPW